MTIYNSTDAHFQACAGIVPGQAGEGVARTTSRPGEKTSAGKGCTVSGDPGGRRIVLIHANSSESRAWARLLRSVPPGQEWVAVARPDPRPDPWPDPGPVPNASPHGEPEMQAASLRPLLAQRRGRKPLLIGCGAGVPVALRAALDFPDLIGGLLLIDPSSAEPARAGVLRRIAARLMAPARRSVMAELHAMLPQLGTIRAPVTLMHGKDERQSLGASLIEQALVGCRNLTVVAVPGEQVQPTKHEAVVRGALIALVGAVERGGA
ncbi:alpha/beta fold hydrolase [Azospirillum soli]|uniref:alpha/beta fold hydrolase n=1 Tax=Azospirillum soli TaxID=1304799 RepID=UPI001AEA60F9|nr:alpha/beta hydrolase [Azospirillum soli]MBP2315324.1 pimeloyl-ACP methyl ester carboxylesterase [Azospirillum soli]